MTRRIYGHNAWNVEAPFEIGIGEWGDESARCSINMDWDIQPSSLFQIVH